jgi:HlyD family secretion protein
VAIREDAGVATVPPEAIVSFAGVNKVFIVDGDRAKAIEVQPGQRDRTWVEVVGPIPPGSRVITSGFSQLVDGSPIRVR